jgi:hypothetical protein
MSYGSYKLLSNRTNTLGSGLLVQTNPNDVDATLVPGALIFTGTSLYFSNGSSWIQLSSVTGTFSIGDLIDVDDSGPLANNYTLVYNTATQTYVVKDLDINGGEF